MNRNKAYTLLELLISMSIFSFVLLTMSTMITLVFRVNIMTKLYGGINEDLDRINKITSRYVSNSDPKFGCVLDDTNINEYKLKMRIQGENNKYVELIMPRNSGNFTLKVIEGVNESITYINSYDSQISAQDVSCVNIGSSKCTCYFNIKAIPSTGAYKEKVILSRSFEAQSLTIENIE